MPWDKGFNFRATSAYVTDGADETYVIEPSYYPTTRNSVTFGWVTTQGQGNGDVQARDKDSALDRRIAGLCYFQNFTADYFQVNLPEAGTYSVYFAGGNTDQTGTTSMIIKDTSTTLYTLSDVAFGIGHYIDAMGTDHTSANWPANNVPKTGLVFSTTVFRLFTTATGRVMSHLRIVQEQTTPDPTIRVPNIRPRMFAPGTAR